MMNNKKDKLENLIAGDELNPEVKLLVLEVLTNEREDLIADIRNKLGHVTALIDLIRLRDSKHKDYVEGKIDEQVVKAIESIKYIKEL